MSSDESEDRDKEALRRLNPSFQGVKNLDDFIKLGKYCYLVLIAAELLCLTTLSSMTYMMYAGANPVVTGCGDTKFNSTKQACDFLSSLDNSSICELELDYQFYSVNVEFEYFCDASKEVKNSISWQMAAVLAGAFVAGQLSDLFGRRITLLVSSIGVAIFSLASAYSNSLFVFTAVRMLNGFFTGGISAVQGVYMVENIPKKHRMLINTVITWSPNFIIYPIIAYFCNGWRLLSIICSVIALLTAVSVFLMFESPRFLIQKGRISEARAVLRRIRSINGDTCEIEAGDMELMLRHEQMLFDAIAKRQKHTFYHLICTWKMLRWTITLCSGITIASLVNYGILFNMEKLSGSLYLNNVFFGIIRWAMNIAVGVLDFTVQAVGRKSINLVALLFNVSCLLIINYVLYAGYMVEMANLVRICSIGVSAMCAQMYLAKFMTCTELYPTAVRNLAASSLSMSSRLGTIFGPQLFYLSDIHPAYPYTALLILCSIDMVTFQVVLPETKGRNLENHLPPKDQRLFYKRPSIVD